MIVSYETLRTLTAYLTNCKIGLLLCDEQIEEFWWASTRSILRSCFDSACRFSNFPSTQRFGRETTRYPYRHTNSGSSSTLRSHSNSNPPVFQNDLSEYFSLLNFANPNYLGSNNDLKKNFENHIIRGRDASASDHVNWERKETEGIRWSSHQIHHSPNEWSAFQILYVFLSQFNNSNLTRQLKCLLNTNKLCSAACQSSNYCSIVFSSHPQKSKPFFEASTLNHWKRSTFWKSFAITPNFWICLMISWALNTWFRRAFAEQDKMLLLEEGIIRRFAATGAASS